MINTVVNSCQSAFGFKFPFVCEISILVLFVSLSVLPHIATLGIGDPNLSRFHQSTSIERTLKHTQYVLIMPILGLTNSLSIHSYSFIAHILCFSYASSFLIYLGQSLWLMRTDLSSYEIQNRSVSWYTVRHLGVALSASKCGARCPHMFV